jgi:hypothetical protein
LRCRVYALERGRFPGSAERQSSTGYPAAHRSDRQEQQTDKCDLLKMTSHQVRRFTCSYSTQRDKSL